jgi:hypothetical protein
MVEWFKGHMVTSMSLENVQSVLPPLNTNSMFFEDMT